MSPEIIARLSPLVALVLVAWLTVFVSAAQDEDRYDLLIKGGHVIDPKNGVDGLMDVAISAGRIAAVAPDLPAAQASRVVEAGDLYIVPGLIDLHVHVFHGMDPHASYGGGPNSLPPDGFTSRVGVTTAVDVGGAGWRTFHQFKEQVIDRAQTRILAFLNIVGWGMKGNPVEQDLGDMDPKLTAMRIREFPGLLVGVKVAHYTGPEWDPVTRAVQAGRLADVPVMVDFGRSTPPLPLQELLLTHLRPGDILTHTYAHADGRIPIVDERGNVRPFVWEARRRGVLFDVGHGGGSFVFRQAVPALKEGFAPDSISTDLHRGSMNAGMKDQLNVMSKFLNLGMSLPDVIERCTWNPARFIKREDLGHLSVGGPADVAVLRLRRGDFGFIDVGGGRMKGNLKLECELTLREGRVVWDLNGISRPDWDEDRSQEAEVRIQGSAQELGELEPDLDDSKGRSGE